MERPTGDEWRLHERMPGQPDRSRHHMQANRNKRAVCLDLTKPSAREVLRALIARADVLVTNMRPGVPEKLGFGWEECRALNPGLVYCALSAFGTEGPRGGRAGYDLLGEALAGFMPLSRARARSARRPRRPSRSTTPPCRCSPARRSWPRSSSAGAPAGASASRRRSWRGRRPQRPLAGARRERPRPRRARPSRAPSTAPTARATAGSPSRPTPSGSPGRFCAAARDAGPARRAARGTTGPPGSTRADELVALFAPRIAERTTAEWDEAMAAAGVPAAPVRERDDLFDDEQVVGRGPARAGGGRGGRDRSR